MVGILPGRRWRRFSLRTLLVLLTVVGVWLGVVANRAHRQRRAVDTILSLGGALEFDYEVAGGKPPGPAWLRQIVGIHYFASVAEVTLDSDACRDDDLAALLAFGRLKRLRLVNCSQITDDGLQHVAHMKQLELLWLSGANIGDSGLAHISGMSELQKLGLGGTRVTDAGLAHVAGLANLHELNLHGTRITDDGLPQLKKLKALRSLTLGDTRITNDGLAHIGDISSLQKLWLQEPQLTDAGMHHLARLSQLKQLELGGTKVTDAGLPPLYALSTLNQLSLTGTPVGFRGIRELEQALPGLKVVPSSKELLRGELRRLGASISSVNSPPLSGSMQMLRVPSYGVSREELGRLLELPINTARWNAAGHANVDWISLSELPVDDSHLPLLVRIPGLKRISLHGTMVSEKGLRQLDRALPGVMIIGDRTPHNPRAVAALEDLDAYYVLNPAGRVVWVSLMNRKKHDEQILAWIGELHDLQYLDLRGSRVSNAGLAHLRKLHKLEYLNLSTTHVTDAGLEGFAESYPNLRWFLMHDLKIDDGLRHLRGLKNLRALDLSFSHAGDEGLQHLSKIKSLQSINVQGTFASEEGLQQLQSLLPKCRIDQ